MTPRVEKLGIKAKALNRCLLENYAARFAAKGLEAALRIDKWQTENGAHNKIENHARVLAKGGLPDGNQTAVQRARANSHIVIGKRGEELVRFFNRRRQIRVGKQHDSSARFHHSMTNAVTFSPIRAVGYHSQQVNFGPERIWRHPQCGRWNRHLRRSLRFGAYSHGCMKRLGTAFLASEALH